jgi:hypothetical protein
VEGFAYANLKVQNEDGGLEDVSSYICRGADYGFLLLFSGLE